MSYCMTSEQINKLSTKRLLQIYRNARFEYNSSDLYSDIEEYEKDLERHDEYVQMLKDELATREHIPRKEESKSERQRLAKKHKGGRRSHKKK